MEEGSFDTQSPPVAPNPLADRRQRGRALVFRPRRAVGAGRTTQATASDFPSALRTVAALVGADLSAIVLAGLIGFAATAALGRPYQLAATGPLAAMATVFGLAFLACGLYPAVGLDRVEELRRMVLVAIGAGIVLAVATLAGAVLGRNVGVLVPALVASGLLAVLAPLLRAAVRHVGGSQRWWGVPVVVLGGRSAAAGLVASLQRAPDLGLRPIACFSDDVREHGLEVAGVPIVGRLADARHYRSIGVRHALVIDPGSGAADLAAATVHARGFPSLRVVPRLDGRATVDVARYTAGGGAVPRPGSTRSRHHDVVKRAIDLVLIVPASIVAAPLVAICAFAIAAMSPGNPFYYQAREGRGGRTIRVWKLRTMHQNAEALLERYLNENPVGADRVGAPVQARRRPAHPPWRRHLLAAHEPRRAASAVVHRPWGHELRGATPVPELPPRRVRGGVPRAAAQRPAGFDGALAGQRSVRGGRARPGGARHAATSTTGRSGWISTSSSARRSPCSWARARADARAARGLGATAEPPRWYRRRTLARVRAPWRSTRGLRHRTHPARPDPAHPTRPPPRGGGRIGRRVGRVPDQPHRSRPCTRRKRRSCRRPRTRTSATSAPRW